MNRDEITMLMAYYPVYTVNLATRELGDDASYAEIRVECEWQFNAAGRKGKTFIQEVGERVGFKT